MIKLSWVKIPKVGKISKISIWVGGYIFVSCAIGIDHCWWDFLFGHLGWNYLILNGHRITAH
jgi:hypothetical protein